MAKKFKFSAVTRSSGGLSRRIVRRALSTGQGSQNEPSASGDENLKENPSAESSSKTGKNESKIYLDSSALIRLYFTERDSRAIADFITRRSQPLAFSHLHELEIKNAFRLKIFRGEASEKSAAAAIRLIEQDHAAGVLQRPNLNWFDVFRKAEALSSKHASRIGSRSLDLLHVASALLLKMEDFLTFDDRQSALAGAAGLNCIAPSDSSRPR